MSTLPDNLTPPGIPPAFVEAAKEAKTTMQKHFVVFYSPGTFVPEQSSLPVDSWDVPTACEMAHSIKERYGATPFGFRFTTRGRGENDLDSKLIAQSNLYYLGGEVLTLADIEQRNDPGDSILISNMKGNRIERVIVNINSYKFTSALEDSDVVLDWKPAPPTETGEAEGEGE